MIDFDHGVDPDWQANVLRHMCTHLLHDSEPQEWLDKWLDEAADGDESYVIWVLVTWRKLRDLASFELERLAFQTNQWQAHRNFGVEDRVNAP